jgi:endonuclease YncB( thermonuclease family)
MSTIQALHADGRPNGPLGWRHRRWFVAATTLAAAFLLYTGKVHAQSPHRIEGKVTVVDGDTLRMGDHTVRLWGVDAPAAQQICQLDGKPWACGDASRAALAGYVANRRVHCDVIGNDDATTADASARVARCRIGHKELNGWLVQEGWALDTPKFDTAREYTHLQNDAALARRGLWQGQFVEPWEWRVDDDAAAPSP